MLRVAAERAASTVYVVAQSRPMIRVDGEISALEGEPILSASDIERLIASLAPRKPEAAGDGPIEWISEVPEVGRVRCVTFRDHRGPGLIFRMVSARSISADHLNLSPEIRDLAAQADGFVLVTGARGSGKSTLLNAFVDLINRTRSDHVITIESEIGFVHESRRSFVSQRDVHNDPAAAAAAAQAALKEDPDVLVIEDLHSPESISAALEAAESGRLVFASITASSSAGAIEALVEMFPAGQRAAVRAALSRTLRAVVSQVLVRKAAGGRVTARELLLNSPAVAAAIREGRSSDVGAALEAGQRHGMVSMNDSLAALVRGGTVHGAEAYRRAPDRGALLACLAREGVDTAFAERLA
jgi:twitching motility protein PilT